MLSSNLFYRKSRRKKSCDNKVAAFFIFDIYDAKTSAFKSFAQEVQTFLSR